MFGVVMSQTHGPTSSHRRLGPRVTRRQRYCRGTGEGGQGHKSEHTVFACANPEDQVADCRPNDPSASQRLKVLSRK